MLRTIIAALAAAFLLAAPAAAQEISVPGGFNPPVTASCGTVTVSTPCLDLSQTWNNAGVTFTGLKLNVTDTASASASVLMDLQVGGVSRFSVSKGGDVKAGNIYYLGSGANGQWAPAGLELPAAATLSWSATSNATATADVLLYRDAANTMALRNGTSAQTFNVYNTYTDASNYENGGLQWSGNTLFVGTAKAGTGSARALTFQIGGTGVFGFSTAGHFLASADNTYDIGANGANRPRNLFVANQATFGGTVTTPYVLTTTSTVASLTACSAGQKGLRSFVTDATASTFMSAVTGGGSTNVPVVCDGTSWKIGALDLDRLSPANDNLPPGLLRAFG